MKIITTSDGKCKILSFLSEKNIAAFTLDFGDCHNAEPIKLTLNTYISDLDIIARCEGLDKDLRIFTVCSSCRKTYNDCSCDHLHSIASNYQLCVRDLEGKLLGYIQRIEIFGSADQDKPIVKIYKYEIDNSNTEDIVVKRDENGQPKLFIY